MNSGYAPVNGLHIYYEVHGSGEPLVLLHGGVGGIVMFGQNVEALARGRQVIAVELQGHGRTADVDRPLSFESMADDVAGLIRHLNLDGADVLGYSLGGGAALQLAIRHPELVHRLVLVATAFKRNCWYPEVLAGMASMGPETARMMAQSPLAKIYPEVDWVALFTKLSGLLQRDYDWSGQVAAIQARTMLVFADADAISTAAIAEFYGLLGGGQCDAGQDGSRRPRAQLAILPGHTHYSLGTAPALVAAVTPFLESTDI